MSDERPVSDLHPVPNNRLEIECRINGKPYSLKAYPMSRLLNVLREQTHLSGTKEGCGEGECGACSVIVNGALVNSCLVPALQAQGSEIVTIEGVANEGVLHPIQDAFLKFGGAQCGICTPGMILATWSLLKENPHPTDTEIREGLAGNICRCTGYIKIFEAVRSVFAKATHGTEATPAKLTSPALTKASGP